MNKKNPGKNSNLKLAIIVSHPIQHFAPVYQLLNKQSNLDLTVVYYTDAGAKSYYDAGFNKQIAWDIDLLTGYKSIILNPGSKVPNGFTLKAYKLWNVLNNENPDVILCYGYATIFQWIAWSWALLKRKKILYFSDSTSVGHHRNWIKRIVKNLPVRLFFQNVNLFLSVGDRNELYLKQYGAKQENIRRCPLSVDIKRFRVEEKQQIEWRNNIRTELKIAPEDFVLLFSGKFNNGKRPQDLIFAVLKLAEQKIPVTAILLGDGETLPELKKAISKSKYSNSVHFLGFINQSKIVRYQYAADCCVMPSELDAHPLVVTEAIACGLPVIASNNIGCVGPTDTVQDGVNSFVYPTGDIDVLIKCIKKMQSDQKLWSKMSISSQEIAKTQDIEVAAETIIKTVIELT